MADELRAILADETRLTHLSNDVFNSVDTNLSGHIDRNELKVALLQLAEDTGLPTPTDDQVHEILRNVDADHSGALDRDEFKVLAKDLFELVLATLA